MTEARTRLAPILLFVVLAALSVLIWLGQVRHRHQLLRSYTATVADQAAIRVLSYMRQRLTAMQVLSDALARQGQSGQTGVDFRFLASVFYAAQPGYQAINWVDSTGVVTVVVPEASNPGILGLDVHNHPIPVVREAMTRARRDTTAVLTPCFELLGPGGEGCVSWWPVRARQKLFGFISGVFRIGDVIHGALAEGVLGDFHVLAREGDRVIFDEGPSQEKGDAAWAETRRIDIPFGREWVLTLTPHAGLVERYGMAGTQGFLLFPLALSLAMAALVHALMRRSRAFQAARDSAVTELALRRQAEDEKEHTIDDLAQANRKLAQANEELDAYIYAASHDVRAPLVAVSGLVDILLDSSSAPDPEERQHVTARIRHNIQKLDTLVQDMLTVSRSRRLERTSAPIDIRDVCTEAWNSLKDLGSERPIGFACGVTPGLTFRSDPLRFRQIVNNLLSNAIKYRDPEKPECRVSVEARLIEQARGRTRLTLVVSDNGVGVPPESAPRIFDMFYKGSQDSFGSGLGLYIVRQHCLALGGDVRYAPLADGSEFTVELPGDPER